jgi:glycosyltransferase involved in cell wall biosynthesis
MYDISILIPTLQERNSLFQIVLAEVRRQISECPEITVEVLWDVDNGEKTLGGKRNDLVAKCTGKYHCFIDDDDVLSPFYLKMFVPMILSGIDYDCASFVGAYYHMGEFKKLFYHSMSNTSWYETPERYIRTVSPLNLIRTSIVRDIQYADIRNTEDHEFSVRLHESGLLKKEFKIDETIPLYHYIDGVKDTRTMWSYTWNGHILELKEHV